MPLRYSVKTVARHSHILRQQRLVLDQKEIVRQPRSCEGLKRLFHTFLIPNQSINQLKCIIESLFLKLFRRDELNLIIRPFSPTIRKVFLILPQEVPLTHVYDLDHFPHYLGIRNLKKLSTFIMYQCFYY